MDNDDEKNSSINKTKIDENSIEILSYKCHLCQKISGNSLTCSKCVNTGKFCSSKHNTRFNEQRKLLLNVLNKNDNEEFYHYSNNNSVHFQYSDGMFLLKKCNAEKKNLEMELEIKIKSSKEIRQKLDEIEIRKTRLNLMNHLMKRLREQNEQKKQFNNKTKQNINDIRRRNFKLKEGLIEFKRVIQSSREKKEKKSTELFQEKKQLDNIRQKRFNELYKFIFPIERATLVEEDLARRIKNLSYAQQTSIDEINNERLDYKELLVGTDYKYQIVNSCLSSNGDYQINNLLSNVKTDINECDPDSPQSSVFHDLHEVLSALSHACQLINVIANYLHINLPFRLNQQDFHPEKPTANYLRANIAKLNANIYSSCLSQGISIKFENITHTLENLLELITLQKYADKLQPIEYTKECINFIETEANEMSPIVFTDRWFDGDYKKEDTDTNHQNNNESKILSEIYDIPDDCFIDEENNLLSSSTSQQQSSIMNNSADCLKNKTSGIVNSIDKIMSSTLSSSASSYFLQEMAYPPYCIQPLKSWGMIAIGGGGGTAKTGVANAVDLKWIYLNQPSDPENNKCAIENVNSFSQHDSVMRMVSLCKQHEYLILALNRHLKIIMLKPSQQDMDDRLPVNCPSPMSSPSSTSQDVLSLLTSVRRRKSSLTSDVSNTQRHSSTSFYRNRQATVEAVGNETTVAVIPSNITPTTRRISFTLPPNTSPTTTTSTTVNNVYTVPIQEQEYVNAIAICSVTQSKLFVGASDGSLTIYDIIWPAISSFDRLIQLNLLTSFTAHTKEIDDLAVDLLGTWLVSVSRDYHVHIRQCSSPFDKHGELDLCQFGTNKTASPSKPLYRIRHVRFGFVPKTLNTKCYLYTSLIPQLIGDKLISYIVQWYENKQHQFIVRQRRGVSYDRISAIAVSSCGKYISAGDSDGYVRIYETNHLILLYENRSHSIFVTDLAFILHEENYLYETSVLSISADKNLYVHNIHPAQTDLLTVSFLIIIGLLLFFFLFSQIRFTFH